jgi:hypothetical protein
MPVEMGEPPVTCAVRPGNESLGFEVEALE